ncbi:MAG TPA: serine/threonine-protein kinase [Gemmataceae bacterium]|nr:serine/threonine-protein kinase [Gemmataceae bacterium]
MDAGEPDLDDPRVFQAVQEYLAALEAGKRPDRSAFLARHAEIAPALSECLASLELIHTAGPKLRDPAPGATVDPPTALGDFRIVREIGRGGMGTVYEAVQLSLGRRVALKVLPFAAALDARQLRRFQNEAQAAAHLHHPHIVPVYFVGAERGVHFYAMQLIEGQNLAALVEELRRESSGTVHDPASAPTADVPRPSAETRPAIGAQFSTLRTDRAADFYRTVARLAAQAAEALEFAHQNGIVHRDIKPANLLVDGSGNLWVTDFGLAQVQADAGLTQTGDLLGTLRYMSPEQAGGPRGLIDHRTDVYSLGATLYEVLTLRPIFDGQDRRTLLHQIIHDEPRPPRAIDRTIPLDLETIVLKAIGKHPADRYATARDLADDLNRFLRHEPVRARRATPVQRARKWLRRHPSVPATAAVLLFLLTAGSVVSALLIQRAYHAERERAREADERLRLAGRSVDDMVQAAEQELADHPPLRGLRKKLLESALGYYQELARQRSDDPAVQAEFTAAGERVKKILEDLAVLEGAGPLFLLNNPEVLDDLPVTDDQRQRLAELNRRLDQTQVELFRDYRQLTPDERKARFLQLARDNEAGVAEILDAKQLARLRQIDLQTKGPGAFREPAVVAALGLTPEQQNRIRAVEADVFLFRVEGPRFGPPPRGGPPPGPPPGLPPDKFGRHPDDLRRAAIDRILGELTEDQRARWRELVGKPFAWRKMDFKPGPFGPGPKGPPPFGPPR